MQVEVAALALGLRGAAAERESRPRSKPETVSEAEKVVGDRLAVCAQLVFEVVTLAGAHTPHGLPGNCGGGLLNDYEDDER